MDKSEREQLLVDFCEYCESVNDVWAKEFSDWIPYFLAEIDKQKET